MKDFMQNLVVRLLDNIGGILPPIYTRTESIGLRMLESYGNFKDIEHGGTFTEDCNGGIGTSYYHIATNNIYLYV